MSATSRAAFTFCFFTLMMSITSLSGEARAGFEWIPPSEIMAQTPAPQSAQTPDFPLPVSPDMPPSGGAAANVSSMPLDLATTGAGDVVPVQQKPSGLYIDPFPDRAAHGASPGDSMIGIGPVEQAMMEVTQDLNPAPLGYGFTTAPKAKTRKLAMPETSRGVSSTPEITAEPLPPNSMTALPGEETPSAPPAMAMKSPAPEPYMPPASSARMEQPVYPNRAPAPAAYNPPVGQYALVQGFGRDMPLAMALTQVVPPNYALSFGAGVNPGASVSWEGGKPWNEVLRDMLQSAGLSADIRGKVILVNGA